MRTVADYLGIMTYLWIMYGGPPDRALVAAALRADTGTDTSTSERPPSISVVAPQPPVDEAVDAAVQSKQVAA